ncbi:hypothetical protein BV22DRAFT_1195306 [Leucogyrophana mollusca]|uniref:Uncharacterized protein n=1 Tax=Leucogyrophana mollusca TaxID=85980 RepID=A0ACB8BHC9_9AGAM|nr:hypothetical protein BV22DRAFT_1195306 [Leucogyrophana mollusca]
MSTATTTGSMSPIGLLDLPNETLLGILAQQNAHTIKDLSLVCKRLNTICGHWTFQTYYLCLRMDMDWSNRDRRDKRLTPLDTSETMEKWDREAVLARLTHLSEKATYVRELVIYNVSQKDMDLFPEDTMPELERVLKLCTQVTTVTLKISSDGTMPLFMWEWFTTLPLRVLNVGRLAPPEGQLQPLTKVTHFEGFFYDKTRPFLYLVKPQYIVLNYWQIYDRTPATSFFKPTREQFPDLKSIRIKLFFSCSYNDALFDFSEVPQAKININFELSAPYKVMYPAAWKRFKKTLPKVFVEDLTGFDVNRRDDKYINVSRPPQDVIDKGWTPQHADHLQGVEQEELEQAAVTAYARYRLTRELEF